MPDPAGSARDLRMDLLDYRPDVYGLVEGPADTPPQIVAQACAIECPDCRVNVFIERDAEDPTGYAIKVAHDDRCPWLAEHEKTT